MEKEKTKFITNEDLKKIINEYEKYVRNNLLGKKLEFDEGYSSKYIHLIAKTLGKNMLLQQKIDKAIEYIRENQQKVDEMGDNYCYLNEYEINDLSNILKGEDIVSNRIFNY